MHYSYYIPLENVTCDLTSNKAYDSTVFSSCDMLRCHIPRPFKS